MYMRNIATFIYPTFFGGVLVEVDALGASTSSRDAQTKRLYIYSSDVEHKHPCIAHLTSVQQREYISVALLQLNATLSTEN